MHICPCLWAVEISKKIWIQMYSSYFQAGDGRFCGDFPPFCVLMPREQTYQLFILTKNCSFSGASFELIKNLTTFSLKKLQGFRRTLMYHCYTLSFGDIFSKNSLWASKYFVTINLFNFFTKVEFVQYIHEINSVLILRTKQNFFVVNRVRAIHPRGSLVFKFPA